MEKIITTKKNKYEIGRIIEEKKYSKLKRY